MLEDAVTNEEEIEVLEDAVTNEEEIEMLEDAVTNEEEIEVLEDDLEAIWGESAQSNSNHLTLWLVFLIACLQRKHYIPDVAIEALLQIFYIFLRILSKLYTPLSEVADSFPSSVRKMQIFLGLKSAEFIKYVTCPKCSEIYTLNESIEKRGSRERSRKCTACNSLLLQTIETCAGKQILRPYRIYCYYSLKKSLQNLLKRPGFMNKCKHWLTRTAKDGVFEDIYDGRVWQSFQYYEGKEMLADGHTLGLMLNIDWFNPFKHIQYSVGGIYISIINLPRELRYRPENIMIVGLIPGPREPQRDINTFLRPLVSELLDLFNGVEFKIFDEGNTQKIRCLLLCVACDIPAGRKVCGFLGHMANLGCSKCFKKFSGSLGNKDYSGFERPTWRSRSGFQHRGDVEKILKCNSKTEKLKLESELGCRYSVLLDLPYFDPVKMTPIDPMHNLFLGTAKRMIRLWIEKGLLLPRDYDALQKSVNEIHVPSSVGRIPSKIASSFSSFTADQLKNWTTLFSLMVLINRFSKDDIECWRHFVLAVRLLCNQTITLNDISLADALLIYFCKRVQRMYGNDVITPNMHLHCHLKECILDYGTIYSFWLFSFERFNGILEHYPSNNRNIEVCLMNRFLTDFSLASVELPHEYEEDFHAVLMSVAGNCLKGSLQEMNQPAQILTAEEFLSINQWTIPLQLLDFGKSFFRCCFNEQDLHDLHTTYSELFPNSVESIRINSAFKKYYRVNYRGMSFCTRSTQNLLALAYTTHTVASISVRPVLIHYFVKHSIEYNCSLQTFALVAVSWLLEHPSKDTLGKPLQIWWKDLYDDHLAFIPIQYIFGPCVYTDYVFEGQTVVLLSSIHHCGSL